MITLKWSQYQQKKRSWWQVNNCWNNLAPDKCVWFLICHRFKNWKSRQLTMNKSHEGIEITSRASAVVSGVKRKVPNEVHRTLVFQMTGNGRCDTQKRAMKYNQSCKQVQLRAARRGWEKMAWRAMHFTWRAWGMDRRRWLCHVVNVRIQCNRWLMLSLPRWGSARTAPRDVVFGRT